MTRETAAKTVAATNGAARLPDLVLARARVGKAPVSAATSNPKNRTAQTLTGPRRRATARIGRGEGIGIDSGDREVARRRNRR